MTKPTIVLVHGFWGDAAHWSKVILQLSKMGYESIFAV
jgi:pimeloyl-ACP methyl ester carboxylesterase